ncbi:restriction endonuclease subunit S [Maribacter sp. R77961]|uniref:restriction endonuclease subunit S n=1 Tax=Maribacter sp. R77961 TaxID=3093871 RepID=UPI0037C7088B
MNKEKQNIVPALRFPEFVNDGEWEIRGIEKNISMISGIALKSNELSEDKSGTPILRGINITEGYIRHSQKIDKFYLGDTSKFTKYLVDENDIVIGMDGSKVGKNVALVSKFDIGSILIQRVARIRAIDSDIKYLYQNFISKRFITYVDNVNTSSGIPHISAKQIKDFKIGFPPKLKEQKKIANCLSSLDTLIAAETDKLAHLKDHKKGLLQQLFPKAGETKPQYRFPEFVGDGDWEEKEIGQIFKFKQGVQVPINNQHTTKDDGMVRFIRIIDITGNSEPPRYINNPGADHIINEDDLFMIRYGTPGAISIGFDGVIANNLFRLIWKLSSPINSFFWYYAFQKIEKKIYSLSGSSSMPAISFSTLDNLEIKFPENPKEQQKVANCLSSVDDLIAAQSIKIKGFQAHKKGLMQQLFPNVSDVAV